MYMSLEKYIQFLWLSVINTYISNTTNTIKKKNEIKEKKVCDKFWGNLGRILLLLFFPRALSISLQAITSSDIIRFSMRYTNFDFDFGLTM